MHTFPSVPNSEATTTNPARWAAYVQRHTEGQTQGEVAARTGLYQSTISRWLSASDLKPTAPAVVAFARAYGLPPVEALVVAGVISEAEAEVVA